MKDTEVKSAHDTPILLIDNNKECLKYVHNLLLNEGFKYIVTANSCSEAFEMCDSQLPYLVVTEYNLQSMPGFELISKIKEKCEKIKIVVLSSKYDIIDNFRSLEAGATSYVPKEKFWETNFLQTINNLLKIYRDREQRRLLFRTKLERLTVA